MPFTLADDTNSQWFRDVFSLAIYILNIDLFQTTGL